MARGWIEDDLQDQHCDAPHMERGEAYGSTGGEEMLPEVTRPIGFMRFKPRVRVKAWSMPILPGDL
jgi:hypothetical protein